MKSNKIDPKLDPNNFKIDLSLLDPNISNDKVSDLLYEGNPETIYVLMENPKFNNLDKNVFKTIAKTKYPMSFDHPWFRISLYLAILFVIGIIQIFPFWITGLWLGFCLFYYLFNFKSFNLNMVLEDRARIKRVDDLVINTPYEKSEQKRIRLQRERVEALKQIELSNLEEENKTNNRKN